MAETVSEKEMLSAWAILSVIGGIYALGVGALLMPIPSAINNTIMSALAAYAISPETFAPVITALPLLQLILSNLTIFVGLLPSMMGTLGSGIYAYSILLIIIGILIIIGGLLSWKGMKAGAALCLIFGLIGFLVLFNVGAMLALIGGVLAYVFAKE
ncbi:MAG: hypothetical protein ACTSWP_08545 [Candidatus Freyarchaeota archaeon]|nr:hypothetical protein [Candidatus Freyrarchaeum guaymaensis]